MAKKKSNQMLILTILLAIFVVLSAIQTIEISSLSNKIKSEGFVLGSNAPTTSYNSAIPQSTYSQNSVPQDSQDLPKMVGGC